MVEFQGQVVDKKVDTHKGDLKTFIRKALDDVMELARPPLDDSPSTFPGTPPSWVCSASKQRCRR